VAGLCFSAVDTTEDTADERLDNRWDGNPNDSGGDRRGVAFGVLLGVACRSRMFMSIARSLVAASKMDITPIISYKTVRSWKEKKEN
jgi:hypothetical protein